MRWIGVAWQFLFLIYKYVGVIFLLRVLYKTILLIASASDLALVNNSDDKNVINCVLTVKKIPHGRCFVAILTLWLYLSCYWNSISLRDVAAPCVWRGIFYRAYGWMLIWLKGMAVWSLTFFNTKLECTPAICTLVVSLSNRKVRKCAISCTNTLSW